MYLSDIFQLNGNPMQRNMLDIVIISEFLNNLATFAVTEIIKTKRD